MPTLSIAQALKLGIEHHQAGRLAEAETIYRQILGQDGNHADALHLLGVLAGQAGRGEASEALIRRAIGIQPGEALYRNNLGKLLMQGGRAAEAVEVFGEAVRLKPDLGDARFDYALALAAAGRTEEALPAYGEALRYRPNDPGIHNNIGTLLRSMGRLSEAMEHFQRALQIDPNRIEALGNMGQLLESQGKYAEAIALYDRALRINAGHPTLHYNMGVALGELGRLEEAMASYRQALQLKPDYFEAFNNLANALTLRGRFEEAIDAYREALRINPALAEAWSNLGSALVSCARHDEAMAAQRRAMELRPQDARAHSNLVYTMLFLPEFDAGALQKEHVLWNQRHGAPLRHLIAPHANDRSPERRLRIGFVSPDFRNHVVARNLMPLFRERDREQFEFHCYSNVSVKDAMTETFRGSAEGWRDIRFENDDAVARQIRDDRIDILVDLTLHMAWNRLPVFARKPAPVQVTFAGYPGSTGLETIDYRLTDPHLDPPGDGDRFYSETSIRLPDSFWCYDPLGEALLPNELPAATRGFVTFGCLNAFSKVNEPLLKLWGEVLAAVPASRLMILCGEGRHRERTLDIFRRQGVGAERILFCPITPRSDYLRRYHEIDLVLDAHPYNGHTTSLDGLWMGVPVVTLVGRTVVGRAGYSQLMNLGLPELITHDAGAYVRVAAELAGDLARLKELRDTLRSRMERSPLMDGRGFTRGIENAFRAMWRKWCATGGERS